MWWTWTAPESTFVTLEILNSSQNNFWGLDGLVVYDTTNIFASPSPIAAMPLDSSITNQTMAFPAVAGTNYQIQLLGSSSSGYTMRLIASNVPIIIRQPRSVTVSSNASTLLSVIAAGPGPLTYQWRLYGTNLIGETAPMLALTNIDESQAGPYSVAISNSSSSSIVSATANLWVSQSNVPPLLTATASRTGSFSFMLAGEIGRSYRIESSTDLVGWSQEYAFSYDFDPRPYPDYWSVVVTTNTSTILTITNNLTRNFIRASHYVPYNEKCINNLEQIRLAKHLWQRINNYELGAIPALSDLLPYLPHSVAPNCPFDTNRSFFSSYTMGDLQTDPVCLIAPAYHLLEDPE